MSESLLVLQALRCPVVAAVGSMRFAYYEACLGGWTPSARAATFSVAEGKPVTNPQKPSRIARRPGDLRSALDYRPAVTRQRSPDGHCGASGSQEKNLQAREPRFVYAALTATEGC